MQTISRKLNNRNYQIEIFDSVLEMMETNKKRKINSIWKGRDVSSAFKPSWVGCKSLKDAYRLLTEGWSEGTKKVSGDLKKVQKQLPKVKMEYYNNVEGFLPNVPLSLLNLPNSMINTRKVNQKSKILTLVYDIGASCKVEADEIIEAGKNFVSLVLGLEKSGFRCEIKIMNSFVDINKNTSWNPMITVKKAMQPLNLKKMMFPMAHSGMLRAIFFDWEDKCPKMTSFIAGRGVPFYVAENNYGFNKTDLENAIGKNTIYINYQNASEGYEALKKYVEGTNKAK